MTPKWRSVPGDSPIRDLSNLLCIAEVIHRFDVVAIQEVRASAGRCWRSCRCSGMARRSWVTDVTRGRQGNNERLAFVLDRQRVRPSGVACELVVAAENAGIPEETLKGQFAAPPMRSASPATHPPSPWSPSTSSTAKGLCDDLTWPLGLCAAARMVEVGMAASTRPGWPALAGEIFAEHSTRWVPAGRDHSWANWIATTCQPRLAPPLTCKLNPRPTVV